MAIVVNVIAPELILNETHTGTEIEVYDNEELTGIPVASETLELPNSLTHKTFDKELIPNKRYYVRARIVLTPGGYQGISAVTSFVAGDTNDIVINTNPPTLLNPPTITLVDGVIDTAHVGLVFNQTVTVNDSHAIESVSWILTDSNNIVRFSSIDDTTNIHSIVIDTALKQREVYIMRCMVRLDTGSTSMFGSLTFTTGDIGDRGLDFDKERGEVNNENILHPADAYLKPLSNSINKEVKIYKHDVVIKELTITGDLIQLSPETDEYYSFTIKVTANMQDGTTLGPIYKYIRRNLTEEVSGYPKTFDVEPEE